MARPPQDWPPDYQPRPATAPVDRSPVDSPPTGSGCLFYVIGALGLLNLVLSTIGAITAGEWLAGGDTSIECEP